MKVNYQEIDIINVFNDEYLTFKNNCTNPDSKILKEINIKKLNIIQDRNRVLQIVNNFMSNALKYTIKGEIIMGINYLDNGILIYVKDTGIGISKEKQAKLFKRFEKLDSFEQGTGLGLAICKAIAETMKGKIGFESEKGKGTKFWAWIPCKKIED